MVSPRRFLTSLLVAAISWTGAAGAQYSETLGRAEVLELFDSAYERSAGDVEARLRGMHSPEAAMYLAMFLHWEKPELRKAGGEIAKLIESATQQAADRLDRKDRWRRSQQPSGSSDIGKSTPYDGTTENLIQHLRLAEDRHIYFSVPCNFFLRHPEIGVVARSVSQDRWRRGAVRIECDAVLRDKLPEVFGFWKAAEPITWNVRMRCTLGTLIQDIAAGRAEAWSEVFYSPHQQLARYQRFSRSRARPNAANLTLRNTNLFNGWADLSRWNYRHFARLESLYESADRALTRYYRETFKMSPEMANAASRLGLVTQPTRIYFGNSSEPSLRYLILSGAPIEESALKEASDDGSPTIGSEHPPSGAPEPLLLLAAGRPDIVRRLLDRKFDPNVHNAFGKTALMAAAQLDDLESVRMLLTAGADVNARLARPDQLMPTSNGVDQTHDWCEIPYPLRNGSRTALMYAAAEASLPVTEALLAAGANAGLKDSRGADAVDYLTGKGPVPINPKLSDKHRDELAARLKRLARAVPIDGNAVLNGKGQTALRLAAIEGNAQKVAELLRKGADPNIGDIESRYPLDIAASRNSSDIVGQLLNRGAEIDNRTPFGYGALEWAIESNAIESISLLVRRGAQLLPDYHLNYIQGVPNLYHLLSQPDRRRATSLIFESGLQPQQKVVLMISAISTSNVSLIKELKRGGFNFDYDLGAGEFALANVAVQADAPESLQALRDIGVEMSSGRLLSNAMHGGKARALAKLLELGIDPFFSDSPLQMALFIGVAAGRVDLINQALERGADIKAELGFVVHMAVKFKRIELIPFLRDRGVDLNTRDRNGATPLDKALFPLDTESIKALVEAGANPCLANKFGQPALHRAVKRPGYDKVVRFFLESGVSPYSRDSYGITAFDYARYGMDKVLAEFKGRYGNRCLTDTR